jgi:hypothetical protein
MKTENWHEERDRLLALLHRIETGDIVHLASDDAAELRGEPTAETIESVRARIAELESRIGPANDV